MSIRATLFTARRIRRHRRLRARLHGTADRPRLSVFRSKSHVVVQLVDDVGGKTLLSVHDRKLPVVKTQKKNTRRMSPGITRAYALGALLAEQAKKQGITRVVFDRGGYTYHGRIQAVADGARAGGLAF